MAGGRGKGGMSKMNAPSLTLSQYLVTDPLELLFQIT